MKLKHFSTPVVVIGLLIPATTACNQETTISRDEETALNSEGETTNRSEEEQAPSVKNLDAMGSFIGTKNELSGTICFNNIIGKWFMHSHGSALESNGYVAQPYETRVYLFQDRRKRVEI